MPGFFCGCWGPKFQSSCLYAMDHLPSLSRHFYTSCLTLSSALRRVSLLALQDSISDMPVSRPSFWGAGKYLSDVSCKELLLAIPTEQREGSILEKKALMQDPRSSSFPPYERSGSMDSFPHSLGYKAKPMASAQKIRCEVEEKRETMSLATH